VSFLLRDECSPPARVVELLSALFKSAEPLSSSFSHFYERASA
jgi:hypothetical protein